MISGQLDAVIPMLCVALAGLVVLQIGRAHV